VSQSRTLRSTAGPSIALFAPNSGRVVKEYTGRATLARAHSADSVPHDDAIGSAGALYGSIANGKYLGVTLFQRDDMRS
jgi:hypothetical protein